MELINISYGGEGVSYQSYDPRDERLIVTNFINSSFGAPEDNIEYVVYDQNGSFLDINYNASNYYPQRGSINPYEEIYSSINLEPLNDLKSRGIDRGAVNIQYGFYKNLFSSSFTNNYWIKEISPSRTELRLASQTLSNLDIQIGFASFQGYVSTKNYFTDFYLNFGLNRLVIATNAAFETQENDTYLLIKLYEPLPPDFDVKSTLWIVDKLSESVTYNIDIQIEAETVVTDNSLRGPNLKVKVKDKVGQTTPYYNYEDLFSSELSSSMQQLSSYYDDKAISINVDYTNFSNFIHFSSATERLNNFVYKLGLIESYEAEISSSYGFTNVGQNSIIAISQSIESNKAKIDNIIKKFDTYEYYLYYNSESFAWPKTTSTKPYELYSVTSSQALAWLGNEDTLPSSETAVSMLYSASFYDATNKDVLTANIPQYLYEDPANTPFVLFLNMVGQHFDNIWLYYKDVSARYDNTNSPKTGISLDLVGDALKSLGIKLYTNTNISDNLYYSLFGMNPDGSLLPPTGSELIDTYVTSSIDTLSANDLQKEIYKRIYHNVPYLLKTKGTQRSIKALISCFGIPESILEVSEFGGYQRFQKSGTSEIYNNKVGITYQEQQLSASLLSPYTTVQYYDTSYRKNSLDIEVGFSPANTINENIVSSSGFVNIDNLIGNPLDQYKTTYPSLDSYKNTYFDSYEAPHSIWEYIRLIKYYNNSLFKLIKDFVPARSNPSTGIIVKSHILERNKYARNEPSGSEDYKSTTPVSMVSITGGPANTTSYSSSWKSKVSTPTGSFLYSSTNGIEKYTGEFSGSVIKMTDSYFDQNELSSNYSSSFTSPVYVNFGGLYHNVTASVRSLKFLDLDYSYNQIVPVNYGIITASISASRSTSTNRPYSNPNYPYAQLQDTNYTSRAFTDPRYWGSKTTSAKYSTYSPGDTSYGNTAAIDKIKNSFAYLVDIYSSSIYFPGRANAQIKYLIDANQNVLDLTKANNNLFDVQNIFKSQETVDIALFQYDEASAFAQQLANNPTLEIYEGGYRFVPILSNLSGSTPYNKFDLGNPITTYIAGSGSNFSPTAPQWKLSNYNIFSAELYSAIYRPDLQYWDVRYVISASYDPDTTFPAGISGSLAVEVPRTDGLPTEIVYIYFTPGGNSIASAFLNTIYEGSITTPSPIRYDLAHPVSITTYPANPENSSNYIAYYINYVTSSQTGLYYMTSSNQIVIKLSDQFGTQDVVESYNPIFSSSSDPVFDTSTLSRAVTPFYLEPGDRIAFYNSASLGWDERFEFSIKSVTFTGSSNATESRILAELDRRPPLNLFTLTSKEPYSVTNANYSSSLYIVYKHIPDETNVIVRYDPKDSNIIEEGLLYPQYMSLSLKAKSGNIVKALRGQNLIQTSNTAPQ